MVSKRLLGGQKNHWITNKNHVHKVTRRLEEVPQEKKKVIVTCNSSVFIVTFLYSIFDYRLICIFEELMMP